MWYNSVWWNALLVLVMLGLAIAARISYVRYLGNSIIDKANKSESFIDNMAEAEMARSFSKGMFIATILQFIFCFLPAVLH